MSTLCVHFLFCWRQRIRRTILITKGCVYLLVVELIHFLSQDTMCWTSVLWRFLHLAVFSNKIRDWWEVCFSYVKLVNSHCERRCPHSRLPLLEEFDLKIDSYETVQAHIFLRKLYVSPDHSYLSLKTAHLYLHWRAFPIVTDYKNVYENCESSCSRHWYK